MLKLLRKVLYMNAKALNKKELLKKHFSILRSFANHQKNILEIERKERKFQFVNRYSSFFTKIKKKISKKYSNKSKFYKQSLQFHFSM